MASARIQDIQAAQLPVSEQLLRLNRLRSHLRAFLFRYTCEPQTREAFKKREALREELKALEGKCSRLSGMLESQGGVLESLKKELLNTHLEFNRLEKKVRQYLDQG